MSGWLELECCVNRAIKRSQETICPKDCMEKKTTTRGRDVHFQFLEGASVAPPSRAPPLLPASPAIHPCTGGLTASVCWSDSHLSFQLTLLCIQYQSYGAVPQSITTHAYVLLYGRAIDFPRCFFIFLSPVNRLGLFKTYIQFSKIRFLSFTTHPVFPSSFRPL